MLERVRSAHEQIRRDHGRRNRLTNAGFLNGWVIKAIEHEGELIGFTMFGWSEEEEFYELCRIMIDFHYQNKGYGTQAIKMILDEMKARFGCREVYLSTDPENAVGKHVYEKVGFKSENRMVDDEELFKIILD